MAIRRQHWRPLILLLIFFLALYLWIEENLKFFIERKLGQLLKIDVEIGSVRGGILNNLVLLNLKLLPRHPSFNLPRFETKKIRLNFRFRDILFGKITLKNILPLVIAKGKLSLGKPLITELFAQITDSWCVGNFYLFGGTKMKFAGDIAISKDGLRIDKLSIVRLTQKGLTPQQKRERINIEGEIDLSNFLVEVNLEHLQIRDLDLSTDIKIKNKIAKGFVKGELSTSNSIIDFNPAKEIKADYQLSASTLRLITLKWGREVRLSGIIELSEPTYVDLLLEISDVNLGELAFLAGAKEEEKEKITGLVNGKFVIKGFLPSPDIKGGLVSIDGNLGDVDYDQVKVNLEGKTPVVKIVDSWIRKEERYTLLEGEINLAKVGSGELFKNLEIIFDEKAMVWKGWDITRDSGPELELGRDVGDDFRVRFKTFMNNELLNEDVKGDEFGLDYKLTEDETLKMRLKETEEFLGVERKLKF